MAHYAEISQDNHVLRVITVANAECVGADGTDDDALGEQFCKNLFGGSWKRTSYNTLGGRHLDPISREPSLDQSKSFRYNYAVVGGVFDPDFGPHGAFLFPQPFPSWVLNPDTALWDAPVPMPETPGMWVWDEATLSWVDATPAE